MSVWKSDEKLLKKKKRKKKNQTVSRVLSIYLSRV